MSDSATARQVAAQNSWREKTFDSSAIAELRQYSWPGNVRELRNVVERLVLLSTDDSVTVGDVRTVLPASDSISGAHGTATSAANGAGTLAERSEAFEREVLTAEIRKHNFHMTNVARALGLERSIAAVEANPPAPASTRPDPVAELERMGVQL